VDDDADELVHLELIPHLTLFRGKPDAIEKHRSFIRNRTTCVQSWAEIEMLWLP
jgi:transposase